LRVDRLKVAQIRTWYDEMVNVGLVRSYVVHARAYGWFPTWAKYQRTRVGQSKFPDPPPERLREVAADSRKPPHVAEYSGPEKRVWRREKRSETSEKGGQPQPAGNSRNVRQLAAPPPPNGSGELSPKLQEAIQAMQSRCFHGLGQATPFTESFWDAMLEKVESQGLTIFACLIDVDAYYVRHQDQWPTSLQHAADRMASGLDTAITKLLRQKRKVQHA
jgi:hypothetical protein